MGMKRLGNAEGSITVEMAILLPVLLVVLLFGCVSISFYVQYFQVQQCFYSTAETMTDYAYIYHEKTISKLTTQWKAAISEETDSFWKELLAGIPEQMQALIDVQSYISAYENDLLDQAESQIYLPIAWSIFQYHLQQAELADSVSVVNFSDSTFFLDGSEILLDLTCELPFPLPLLRKNTVQVHYRILVNGWVNGIGGEQLETDEIWEADNFTRGKYIRNLYGSNLPDNFPTIAKFENGRATMIKSVDFRKETYQKEGALSSNVIAMLETLYRYQGQNTPYGAEQIVILPAQIQEKELLLAIPNAEQSEMIQAEFEQAKSWAQMHQLIFTIVKL